MRDSAAGRVAAILAAAGLMVTACSASHGPIAVSRADDPDLTATVLRVVDGDTVDVIDDSRGRLRIRLIGVDSPEVHKPGYGIGCWGPEASEFARSALTGQRVAIVTDPSQDTHDRYGRTLAYVEKAGGWDFSVEAARAGAAKSYVYGRRPATLTSQIQAAEAEAQRAQRGLWGPPCYGHTDSTPVK